MTFLADAYELTVYYYNPNITDLEEQDKRYEELKRHLEENYPRVGLIRGAHDEEKFLAMAQGLESAPEGGLRCAKCFALRLEETARRAAEEGFDYFHLAARFKNKLAEPFLEELKRAFTVQIGDRPEQNPEYPKLITSAAYDKCAALADEYRARILFGGTGDRETRRYSPTLIYPVDITEHIVQHELFCPLLPIVPFKDAEADVLLDVVARREHPLCQEGLGKTPRGGAETMDEPQSL